MIYQAENAIIKSVNPCGFRRAPRVSARGFYFNMPLQRAALFVDGFNLYHAIDAFRDDRLKWLSLWKLGERILPKKEEELVWCGYFTAYANHLRATRPDVIVRHRQYVAAQEATGVTVFKGSFKKKEVSCRSWNSTWFRNEEKETDVNIAVRIVAHAYRDLYDVAYVLSADTDLTPAMREVRSIVDANGHRCKRIVAVFPPVLPGSFRYVAALQQNSDAQINLNMNHLKACRLPDPVILPDGSTIACPPKYI